MTGELKQARSASGIEYMARNWHPTQARDTVGAEMRAHGAAWLELESRAASGADPAVVEAEARRLIGDALIAQRSVCGWFAKVPLPAWTVDDGHVVLGKVRVPLTVDLLTDWMEGETDGEAA